MLTAKLKKHYFKQYQDEHKKILKNITNELWDKFSELQWKKYGIKNKTELNNYLTASIAEWREYEFLLCISF